MQHLSEEALARLVDEEPSELEERHLAMCAECSAERAALVAQTRALAALPELAPPPPAWSELRGRLEAEGLVRPAWSRGWAGLRAAAAVALFLAGGAAGTLWSGRSPAEAPPRTASVENAAAQLRAAEAAYLAALTEYARFTGADQATDPANRLAALEGILLTTRVALQDSPADPVINGYHLAALGQREAMLRQISTGSEQTWY